jgi:hypothetical protein
VRAVAAQRAVLRNPGLNQVPPHGRQQSLAGIVLLWRVKPFFQHPCRFMVLSAVGMSRRMMVSGALAS